MLLPHGVCIVLADGEKFEMFRNMGNEAEPALAPIEAPALHSHNKGAGARRDSSSENPTGHQLREDAHAAAVADWLNHQVLAKQIEHLVVIAAPRTLGEMRRHYGSLLETALLREVSKDLTGRSGPEIIQALRAM
jgi:protein required for attachment to host cells